MCGTCCRLFYINLDEQEYYSGEYLTYFEELEPASDFAKAKMYGMNLLKTKDDGSCVYLEGNKCSIHDRRPHACRDFFCQGAEDKFKGMRSIVASAKESEH